MFVYLVPVRTFTRLKSYYWERPQAPQNILQFDAGISFGTLWVIDRNFDLYYYNGYNYELIKRKFKYIGAGDAGIYAIDPINNFIYNRKGATLGKPQGDEWQFLSENKKKIQFIESAYNGYIFGIDTEGILYYARVNEVYNLDKRWREVPLNLKAGGRIVERIELISCGTYSCYLKSADGKLYGAKAPFQNMKTVTWEVDRGNKFNAFIFSQFLGQNGFKIFQQVYLLATKDSYKYCHNPGISFFDLAKKSNRIIFFFRK